MRLVLLFLFFLSQMSFLFANSPVYDIIRMDGKDWKLMAKPLRWDSIAYSRIEKLLPEEYKWPRRDKENHIGYWTVKDQRIYLVGLKVFSGGKEKVYGRKTLERMFSGFCDGKGIHASWFSSEVRVGCGKETRWSGSNYPYYMEKEYVLGVYKGVIVKQRLYHNHRVRNGFRVDNVQFELEKRFPFDEFPEMEGKEIRLAVGDLKISPDGHLLDCYQTHIFLHRLKPFPAERRALMVKAFEKTMRSIYPWEVSLVNGEYVVASKETFIRLHYPVLTAHTKEETLETGVSVCYLNARKDTIIPFGKYVYCGSDTIRHIGFVLDKRIVCINNKGKELFEVFNHYNTPDPVREGLFRIKDKDGKIGFADPKGNIVIQPQYAFACPFKNNRAKVTYSGERIPVGRNQEHWEWKSDYWFCIDREGNYVTDDPDVKTVKEYVESNAFIDIVPEKYYENLSRHVYSKSEIQNLDNQMKAATYRFYRHCTIDEDGIMTCHAGSGSELNISEEVFEFRFRNMESMNRMMREARQEGRKIRPVSLDERFFNNLLNYKSFQY